MKSSILRVVFFGIIIFSIGIIYFVNVVKQDFHVYTNPEGPDTSDYFLAEDYE